MHQTADVRIKACLQGHCAQVFEQPEQIISLPTEPSTLQNQTQAEHSEALLGTTFQPGVSDRLHSSSHSQTAESTHLPSSMPQTEEPEHLPSSDTNQTDSGGLSGTTVQPIGSTAVDSVGSRPQTKESNPLLNSDRPTAADNIVPISLPSAAETSMEHSAQPDIVHHSTERTRGSGTLASSTAQIDVVPTIESHTAGASTSSSSAGQIPGLGPLPDSASQKADPSSLPGRASETAALGNLPYDIPKTARSLPSCTSAAATQLREQHQTHCSVSQLRWDHQEPFWAVQIQYLLLKSLVHQQQTCSHSLMLTLTLPTQTHKQLPCRLQTQQQCPQPAGCLTASQMWHQTQAVLLRQSNLGQSHTSALLMATLIPGRR